MSSSSAQPDYLNSLFGLTGRVALVTGSTAGLGREMALALCKAGATVVVNGRDEERTRVAVSEMKEEVSQEVTQGAFIPLHGDVSTPEAARDLVLRISEQAGSLDILVNNAGINLPEQPLASLDFAGWQTLQRVNVDGVFHLIQASLPLLHESTQGRIINLSSIGGHVGLKNNAAYASTKGSVLLLTKSLAYELAEANITVNCISPGAMATRMNAKFTQDEDSMDGILAEIPMRRLGRPDDLNGAVLLLSSEAGAYITGEALIVDGGYTAI